VRANGRLTKRRSCSRRLWLRAHGTSGWSLTIHRRLPAGAYKVWARSLDRAFNREGLTRRNTRTFRIKR
jgi:O-phosphoseryl-tRNA(Cys) synthetase